MGANLATLNNAMYSLFVYSMMQYVSTAMWIGIPKINHLLFHSQAPNEPVFKIKLGAYTPSYDTKNREWFWAEKSVPFLYSNVKII